MCNAQLAILEFVIRMFLLFTILSFYKEAKWFISKKQEKDNMDD